MVIHIRKPENEGTLLREWQKKKIRKRFKQDWSKVCGREVQSE